MMEKLEKPNLASHNPKSGQIPGQMEKLYIWKFSLNFISDL